MKNLFKNIFGKNKIETNKINKSWISSVGMNEWQNDIPKLDFQQQKNYYSGIIASCVDVRAENVAKCQPIMYRSINQTDSVELNKHPFVNILANPNPLESSFQFFEKISLNLDLFGNCYIHVLFNNFNMPSELFIIPGDEIEVVANANGLVIGYVRTWKKINGQTQKINYQKNEIIHLKTTNPNSSYYGMSIIQKSALQAGIDLAQLQYQQHFFANDAVPRQILESPDSISNEDLERLKFDFSREYAGARNSGKTPILFGGVTLKTLQTSPKELDYITSRKFTRDELLSMFRVPLSLVGLSENVNKANAVASIVTFHHNVVQPILNRIASQLNKFIAENYNINYFIKFKLPLPEDREREWTEFLEATKLGAFSMNELREFLFYDKKPELDVFYNPNTLGNSTDNPTGQNEKPKDENEINGNEGE